MVFRTEECKEDEIEWVFDENCFEKELDILTKLKKVL